MGEGWESYVLCLAPNTGQVWDMGLKGNSLVKDLINSGQ